MKQKLIDCINGVLKYLPWGEISSHTAEDIAERLIEEELVTDNNVGGKWISVTERLPEVHIEEALDATGVYRWLTSDFVLAYSIEHGVSTAIYEGSDVLRWSHANGDMCKVTHWMPLPEPPKEEQ